MANLEDLLRDPEFLGSVKGDPSLAEIAQFLRGPETQAAPVEQPEVRAWRAIEPHVTRAGVAVNRRLHDLFEPKP